MTDGRRRWHVGFLVGSIVTLFGAALLFLQWLDERAASPTLQATSASFPATDAQEAGPAPQASAGTKPAETPEGTEAAASAEPAVDVAPETSASEASPPSPEEAGANAVQHEDDDTDSFREIMFGDAFLKGHVLLDDAARTPLVGARLEVHVRTPEGYLVATRARVHLFGRYWLQRAPVGVVEAAYVRPPAPEDAEERPAKVEATVASAVLEAGRQTDLDVVVPAVYAERFPAAYTVRLELRDLREQLVGDAEVTVHTRRFQQGSASILAGPGVGQGSGGHMGGWRRAVQHESRQRFEPLGRGMFQATLVLQRGLLRIKREHGPDLSLPLARLADPRPEDPVTVVEHSEGEMHVVYTCMPYLEGRVVDPRGRPLGETWLRLTTRGHDEHVQTDADGRFRCEEMPAQGKIRACKVAGELTEGGGLVLRGLLPRSSGAFGTYVPDARGEIEVTARGLGRVQLEMPDAPSDAEIELFFTQRRGVEKHKQGAVLEHVYAGTYEGWAYAKGAGNPVGPVRFKVRRDELTRLRLVAPRHAATLTGQLEAKAPHTLVFRDPNGLIPQRMLTFTLKPDEEGYFRLDHVPPGTFEWLTPQGESRETVEFHPGGTHHLGVVRR